MMRNFKRLFVSIVVLQLFSLLFVSCSDNREKSLSFVDKGVELYYKSQFGEAFKYFNKAVEEDETNFEAWFWLGNYYRNERKYKKAIKYYSKTIELKPGFADAYANRGFAKNSLKDKKGACEDWKKAEELGKPNLDDYLKWCP